MKNGWVFIAVIAIVAVIATHKIDSLRMGGQPITLDVKDINGSVASLKKELDPFNKPLSSVKFTVVLNLKNKLEPGHEISDGMLIVLAAGEKGLLHGTTSEHFDDSSGERRYFVDIPFDSGNMGEPVATLSKATGIILQFKELLMPLGTVVSGGQVVMVVNNQITVKFDVPGQKIEAKANNNPVIIVKDIQKQMQQVIKPPS